MGLTTIADLVFAAGVVLAALALAGAVLRRGSTQALVLIVGIEAAAAVEEVCVGKDILISQDPMVT